MFSLYRITTAVGVVLVAAMTPNAPAQSLTICDIQYTVNTNGSSTYDGQLVDCAGGIVVGKWEGQQRPRIFLQDPDCPGVSTDPDCPAGWGGIQVKDWSWPYELYDSVQVGDWVELTNVRVEEHVGVTFLQYEPWQSPGYTCTPGYALPPPMVVSVSEIPAPLEYPGDEWHVEDHDAECYESLRLIVRDVTVEADALGAKLDNYELQNPVGESCWAADYMNEDVGPWGYHSFVETGQHFCAVAGLFEQYTSGRFDYYQLITLQTEDLAICGDGNSDGAVDLGDMPRFDECLIGPLCNGVPGGCDPPAWTWPPPGADLDIQHCLMMDFDCDGDVDLLDFRGLEAAFGFIGP